MIDEIFLSQLKQSVDLFLPETILVATFIIALIFDLIYKNSRYLIAVISIIGLVFSGIFLVNQSTSSAAIFSGMLSFDPFGNFFKILILLTTIIIVLMSVFSKELYEGGRKTGEYYILIVGMTFGMFLLAVANNLIIVYLAIETMSISSYILAGYTKEIKRASEASLKYVIFGAVSSGMMIYGISLIYGLTGSLTFDAINSAMISSDISGLTLLIAGLMIIAGIGYKISAVPFHFWTPDVYEGAPITITAYLSVASKAAGFAVLIRFLKVSFFDSTNYANDEIWTLIGTIDWQIVIAILSVLTMTLGNLVALWQTNMKRLLAYSSIAHAGYILMGVVVMTDIGVTSVLIYFFVYMIMNLGAFLVVMIIANKTGNEDIQKYNGIGHKAPFVSACMVIFLISLTGLPPTAGFIGKWAVFTAVLKSEYIWLAVVGVLNSVVSLYYYVKIFRNMYIRNFEDDSEIYEFSPGTYILLIILAVPTLIFGIYFTPLLDWAESSVKIFLGV